VLNGKSDTNENDELAPVKLGECGGGVINVKLAKLFRGNELLSSNYDM